MKSKTKKPAKSKKSAPQRKAKLVKSVKPRAVKKQPKKTTKKRAVKPAVKRAPKVVAKSPARPRPRRRKPQPATPQPAPATELPEILFEGDQPSASGPGQRYALGATAPHEQFAPTGELPEAYGTQKVLVAARDPHWLYVHWDLTREQRLEYNAQSIHKHLVLRLSQPDANNEAAGEVHVHPESRHWFVHVPQAGTKYTVELGYYGKAKGWTHISTSAPALTPPDVVSKDTVARFATIPTEVALSKLVEIVKTGAAKNLSLSHALEELRLAGHPELPGTTADESARPWTPEQERALSEVISMKQLGRLTVGSMDITELVRGELQQNFSSILAALAGPGGISSLANPSSPQGKPPTGPAGFWLNVNAELIVYGATEPTASVTIGGYPVKLRPDGSFSFRFALPDGQYNLPVTAVSADRSEARHADLKFTRATELIGDVGQHPQDPALKTPTPENL